MTPQGRGSGLDVLPAVWWWHDDCDAPDFWTLCIYTRASTDAAADFLRIPFRFDTEISKKVVASCIPEASRTPRVLTTQGSTPMACASSRYELADGLCKLQIFFLFALVRRADALPVSGTRMPLSPV